MAFVDIHLLVQTVLYFGIFISGFVISIPIGVNKIHFDGMCILYADFSKGGDMTPGKSTNCNFPIYLSVFACIFYGLGLGCYSAYATKKSVKTPSTGSQMWVMPFLLLNSAIGLVLLVAAPMISVGFKQFCDHLKEVYSINSCEDKQDMELKPSGSKDKFNSGYYYRLLVVAQVACWTAFLLFLLQVMLGFLRFHRNRKARLTASDKEQIANVNPSA